MIEKVDMVNKDIQVKFMHSHGPPKRFSWPVRNYVLGAS